MSRIITLLALAFLFSLSSIAGVKYYVSPAGAGNGQGNSAANAAAGIAAGINLAVNGDTIQALPGTYVMGAAINITKQLTMLGSGAVVDGGGSWSIATNRTLFQISNMSNVLVDGFTFRNLIGGYSIAVSINGGGRNITVQHCSFSNIGWISNNLVDSPAVASANANAILVDGTSATSLSSINILYDSISNCATGTSEALTVLGNVDTFTVSHNFIHEIANIGIDIAGNTSFGTNPPAGVNFARNGTIDHNIVFHCMSRVALAAGIYLDGAYRCVVYANTVYENGVGISVGAERPANSPMPCSQNRIMDNLIYRNAAFGIIWGDNAGSVHNFSNNSLSNNTFFKNRTGAVINGVPGVGGMLPGLATGNYGDPFGGEVSLQHCDSSMFQNNIFCPWGVRRCINVPPNSQATNHTMIYNDFNQSQNYLTISNSNSSINGVSIPNNFSLINSVPGLDQNSINAYPSFVDTANNNFRLASSPASPCKNVGNPASNTALCGDYDYYGNSRIVSVIDIGAYESPAGSTGISPASNPNFNDDLVIYPNPTTNKISLTTSRPINVFWMLDMNGKIWQHTLGNIREVGLVQVPAGVYQCLFQLADDTVITRKLVILPQ